MKYLSKHYDKVLALLGEHVEIVLISVAISFLVAVLLAICARQAKWLCPIVINALNVIFSIPSLILFTFLVPLSGHGRTSAMIATVIYNLCILTRNLLAGLDSVEPATIEAARGMGLSRVQILMKVELPLALPLILTGLRMSFIMSISLVVLATAINAGGIGQLLFDGLRTNNWEKIMVGIVISTLLVYLINFIFIRAENYALKKANGDCG